MAKKNNTKRKLVGLVSEESGIRSYYTNDEKRKSNPNHREANKNPRNTSKSRGLVKADLDDDSHQISENIDQRDAVLKRGQRKETLKRLRTDNQNRFVFYI